MGIFSDGLTVVPMPARVSPSTLPRMAEPARDEPAGEPDVPSIDPEAIDRAYSLERARRRARDEHGRAARRAHVRFWLTMLVLLVLAIVLIVTVWHEVERLFGL